MLLREFKVCDDFRSVLSFGIGYGAEGRSTLSRTLNAEAVALRLKKQAGGLHVFEARETVGILTETDVLDHVAGA